MHASRTAHRKATLWLAAIVGVLALSLASPAMSQAEESNPNNYNCLGNLAAGQPEAGSEEQQVQYTFYCNGPITGYQVQSQIPVTGVSSPPKSPTSKKKNYLTRSRAPANSLAGPPTASARPSPAMRP